MSLDLSTKSTGYAVYQGKQLIEYGCIKASSTDVIKRIIKIVGELEFLLRKYNFDLIIAEEVLPDSKLPTEAMTQNKHTEKVLMYLQAAVVFLIHENYSNSEIRFLYPSEWRSACNIKTGRGIRRDSLKSADIEFVQNTFNFTPENDDVADAIGIGYGYLHLPTEEPKTTAPKRIYWGQ